jgi:hypothetical protein
VDDTYHLYTDLAWLWPMWGNAASEYARYCRHVTDLIRQHAGPPESIECGSHIGEVVLPRQTLRAWPLPTWRRHVVGAVACVRRLIAG